MIIKNGLSKAEKMSMAGKLYLETIHGQYIGYDDPVFFEKNDFTWAGELERVYPEIMQALQPIFQPEFDGFQPNPETHIQFPPKLWKGFTFYFNGIKFKKNLNRFPYIAERLKSIPHLVSASISILEPGAKVLPHTGSTNAIMRVHLPLLIPGEWPACGMSIAGYELSWREGELLMFCDMQMHHVQNFTSKRRYILLLDVMRPEFVGIKKKICVHTISRILTNIVINFTKKVLNI